MYRNVCVLPDTSFATHEEAGLYIAPSYFEKLETPLKFSQPEIFVVPYAHVRYTIGYSMYKHAMPDFCKNNLSSSFTNRYSTPCCLESGALRGIRTYRHFGSRNKPSNHFDVFHQ